MKTLLLFMLISALAHATPAAVQCNKRKSGAWAYGTAAIGCDVIPVQSKDTVVTQFGPAVLQESRLPADRSRYMGEMFAIVKAMGSYYIHRRNPHVSALEEEGFIQALFTLAAQESFWSHYRLGKDGVAR